MNSSVVHLNVVDFPAAVAMAKDPSLADRAFVVGGAASSRAVVLGVSPRAREEGLSVGMALSNAERRVRGLLVLSPNPAACARVDHDMEAIVSRYSPAVQNDTGGHLYLDLSGTSRLFGPPLDVAVRIRNEISDSLGISATVALAVNKLTAKVITRSIRPLGIAGVRGGDEAAFLAEQDAALLPGVGPAVSRVLAVAGFSTIGEIAALPDGDALALFGRRGLALRNAARGLDDSPLEMAALSARDIRRSLDFSSDVEDLSVIRGALVALVEDGGLEMRRSLLAARRIRLSLLYTDGVTRAGVARSREGLVLDQELIRAAEGAYRGAADRRVRLRSLTLVLEDLVPARREPDLFVPDGPTRADRLQSAVDGARLRFGVGSLTRAICLSSPVAHA